MFMVMYICMQCSSIYIYTHKYGKCAHVSLRSHYHIGLTKFFKIADDKKYKLVSQITDYTPTLLVVYYLQL